MVFCGDTNLGVLNDNLPSTVNYLVDNFSKNLDVPINIKTQTSIVIELFIPRWVMIMIMARYGDGYNIVI